jgi:hypothetical protein
MKQTCWYFFNYEEFLKPTILIVFIKKKIESTICCLVHFNGKNELNNVRSIKKKSSYLDCAILMLSLVQTTIFAYSDFFFI